MSGHSKWANIKYKKERQDAKRGQLFSKLAKEITVTARDEPDPEKNAALSHAIERAKQANMPKENIERAIKRATGELPGVQYEEGIYEGFGPYGVAVMVRVLTDNRNRATSAIRKTFESYGGDLEGSVSWLFERRGILDVRLKPSQEADELLMSAIDLGAEEMEQRDGEVEIQCPPERLSEVKEGLREQGAEIERAHVTLIPKTMVPLEGEEAGKILKFIEALDELEDVQDVYANFDVPDELLAEVS